MRIGKIYNQMRSSKIYYDILWCRQLHYSRYNRNINSCFYEDTGWASAFICGRSSTLSMSRARHNTRTGGDRLSVVPTVSSGSCIVWCNVIWVVNEIEREGVKDYERRRKRKIVTENERDRERGSERDRNREEDREREKYMKRDTEREWKRGREIESDRKRKRMQVGKIGTSIENYLIAHIHSNCHRTYCKYNSQ